MSAKKIMVLAGSQWQIPLIKKIKEMGYKVINVNPYEDSPAFEYTDDYAVLDILDREACLAYAKKENVDAIMSEQCDIANPSVAYLSEKLGLISIGTELAELYTNKLKMRDFCKENGFNYPEFKPCYTIEEAIKFYNELDSKVIVKPIDSNSSRGVFIIDSVEKLREVFIETLSFSRCQKCVICERYIEGTEFTIDGIKTEKGHVSLAISKKTQYKHNPNVACTLFFSHRDLECDYDELKKINDRFVNLTGLSFGLTHAEYKYEDGKFYLIEIGARGGGNLIGSDIVPLMSGVDNYNYLIKKTLGYHVKEEYCISEKLLKRCAVLYFFDVPKVGGKVIAIEGEDILKESPCVIKYALNFKVGDVIFKAKNDSTRVGYYIAYAETENKLREIIKYIDDNFKIILE